jgi:hypothetical protein
MEKKEAKLSFLTWMVLAAIFVNSCTASNQASVAANNSAQELKIMQEITRQVLPNDRISPSN